MASTLGGSSTLGRRDRGGAGGGTGGGTLGAREDAGYLGLDSRLDAGAVGIDVAQRCLTNLAGRLRRCRCRCTCGRSTAVNGVHRRSWRIVRLCGIAARTILVIVVAGTTCGIVTTEAVVVRVLCTTGGAQVLA